MSKRYEVESVLDFAPLSSASRQYKPTESAAQRESLKTMLSKKFQEQYGKKSPALAEAIQKEINFYFIFEELNEATLKVLKQRIDQLAKNPEFQAKRTNGSPTPLSRKQQIEEILKTRMQQSPLRNSQVIPKMPSTMSHKYNQSVPNLKVLVNTNGNTNNNNRSEAVLDSQANNNNTGQAQSRRSDRLLQAGQRLLSNVSIVPNKKENGIVTDSHIPDNVSVSSSQKANSVYYLEGRDEDEWAQIVKFDTYKFEKEKEMKKQKQIEMKLRLKAELEKQLKEKEQRAQQEKAEQIAYHQWQESETRAQMEAERLSKQQKQNRVMQEKEMIEQQKIEKKQRIRKEKRFDKSIDDSMIKTILQEQLQLEQLKEKKKAAEKKRQAQILQENQSTRLKAAQEALDEKNEDIRLQKLYGQVLDEQEATREKEKADRLMKIASISKRFENVVEKKRRETIEREDAIMLQYMDSVNQQEEAKEEQRRRRIVQQKNEVRAYLDKQIEERNQRVQNEKDTDTKQAQIWAKDREEYLNQEKQKVTNAERANKKHQEVLVNQIETKQDGIAKGKMSIDELKHNKKILQTIITERPEQAAFQHSVETNLARAS